MDAAPGTVLLQTPGASPQMRTELVGRAEMFLRKTVGVLLALAFLAVAAGCGWEHSQEETAASIRQAQFHMGSASKTDIRTLFGDPDRIDRKENGDEVWTYSYWHRAPTRLGGGSSSPSLIINFDSMGTAKTHTLSYE